MADARDVIAKALSDQLPSDSRYDIDAVALSVLAALADAAGGRFIVAAIAAKEADGE